MSFEAFDKKHEGWIDWTKFKRGVRRELKLQVRVSQLFQVWQQMEANKHSAPSSINPSSSTLHHANGTADAALPKADVTTSPHHASGESVPLGHNSAPPGPDSPSPSAGESSEAAPLGGIMASRPRLFPESPSRVTWARTPTS